METLNIDTLPNISDSLSTINISETDVYFALSTLDPKKAVGTDKIGPMLLKSCATILTKPLHHLYSISLRYATIPHSWKIHKIIPIFKSGSRNSVKCYRPISLLSNTSKVLEYLIYNKIANKITDSISNAQFGFLKNHSTLQQLLLFTNDLFNSTIQIDTIYFDIRKAFDSVPHNQLLIKLWSCGITGKLWSWFKSYLSNRFQFVAINNQFSTFLPVVSGVPQGSILGPPLFLIYINDIFHLNILSRLYAFADDTKCFNQITNNHDQQSLQRDINLLFEWSYTSCLSFSPTKCVHVSFKSTRNTTYYINHEEISKVDNHRDLGITISNDLSWKNHYIHISAKAYKILGLIRRIFKSSHPVTVKCKLYLSLVRPILTYCSLIWRPYLIADINTLEQIQRRATKYILNDFTSNYKNRLLKLSILPLMYQYEIADILFLIKSLKCPTNSFNINNHITFFTGSSRLAIAHKIRHTFSSNNSNRHSYFNRIPRLWNALPVINLNQSMNIIKRLLKTYMTNHFLANYNPNNSCTLHFLCPCSRCQSKLSSPNFNSINNYMK